MPRFLKISSVFLLFYPFLAFGSTTKVDSLNRVVESNSHDTIKLDALMGLAYYHRKHTDFEKAIDFYHKAATLSQKLQLSKDSLVVEFGKKGEVKAYHRLGYTIKYTKDHEKAVAYFQRSIDLASAWNFPKRVGYGLKSLGYYYYLQGDYANALDFGFSFLQLADSINNDESRASAHNLLGISYKRQMVHDLAIEHLSQAVDLYKKIKYEFDVANNINNIGDVYFNQRKYQLAIEHYQKELSLGKEYEIGELVADAHNCLGQAYCRVASLPADSMAWLREQWNINDEQEAIAQIIDSSMYYLHKALPYALSSKDNYEISFCLSGIGRNQQLQGKHEEAIKNFLESYRYAEENGYLEKQKTAALGAYTSYKAIGDFEKSLHWREVYGRHLYSLFNQKKSIEIGRLESNYNFQRKQELETRAERERLQQLEAETQRKNNLQYSIILFLLVSIFGLVLSLGYIKVSIQFAEGLIFFSFLVLFEFILVLSDPYVEQFTNGEPLYKLLINAGLAAAIFPAHAFFEKTLKNRLFGIKR